MQWSAVRQKRLTLWVLALLTDPCFLRPLHDEPGKPGLDLQDIKDRLVDPYLTALPIEAAPEAPVRESNSGAVARESLIHGIHRANAGYEDNQFVTRIGDYVCFPARPGEPARTVARVTAIFVSHKTRTLAAQLRVMRETAANAQVPQCVGVLWETEMLVDHVPLAVLEELVFPVVVAPPSFRERFYFLQGYYTMDGKFKEPWERPLRPFERAQTAPALATNPDRLPVANLSLVIWGDDFTTFAYRSHSTTTVAFTYAHLPFPLRMSGPWIRIVSLVPPHVLPMDMFRLIFGGLKRLEQGEVWPAATPHTDGKAFVKSSVHAALSDSPFQAKMSFTRNNACHIDRVPPEDNAWPERVSSPLWARSCCAKLL